ncbi:Hypothetical protein D9617_48g089370 [Elsinoe fawcettii]|nr:Hypothetical protein D9617_48g089370 [Elsinoe fawcettii]
MTLLLHGDPGIHAVQHFWPIETAFTPGRLFDYLTRCGLGTYRYAHGGADERGWIQNVASRMIEAGLLEANRALYRDLSFDLNLVHEGIEGSTPSKRRAKKIVYGSLPSAMNGEHEVEAPTWDAIKRARDIGTMRVKSEVEEEAN